MFRIVAAVAVLLIPCGFSGADAPKPSVVPKSWELEFTFRDPERITVTLPGDEQPTTFWYLLYTVTNNTGKEVSFFPTFDLVTEKLDVIEGGFGISPSVYAAVEGRHKKTHRFFVDPLEMYGPLLQGEDNARTSAIAFPELDPSVNSFSVFVGGLSGEIVKVPNRGFDQGEPESITSVRFFTLRKTLAIGYDIPGDRRTQREATPVRVKMEWVMR